MFQFDRAVTICIESLTEKNPQSQIAQGSGRGTDAPLCQTLYRNLRI
jgi:hypothetical protein